jgi:nitrite reductase (NO-forming)
MNNVVLAAIAAGLLIVGLAFCPVFIRQSYVVQAQMQASIRPNPIDNIGHCDGLPTKRVLLNASEQVVQVAPDDVLHPGGMWYKAMVFNNTIPGPLIALTQGENLNVTLINYGDDIHSLDFHMGYGDDQANSGPIQGIVEGSDLKHAHSHTWTICNPAPGAWFYHCSADMFAPGSNDESPWAGIWSHIANGMYGGAVVHPLSELTEKPAKEFYMVFGQLFTNNTHPDAWDGFFDRAPGVGEFSFAKFLKDQPDLILTNGMAFKYVPSIGTSTPGPSDTSPPYPRAPININIAATPFKVFPNNLTRWYIFNAGPNDGVAFHFIGTYQNDSYGFDPTRTAIYPHGHLIKQDMNDQVNWIPPAAGQVFEVKFPPLNNLQPNTLVNDPHNVLYVGVDHNMNHVIKGGAFAVLATTTARAGDQPAGTWVPPIDPHHRHIHCVSSEQQHGPGTACPNVGPG